MTCSHPTASNGCPVRFETISSCRHLWTQLLTTSDPIAEWLRCLRGRRELWEVNSIRGVLKDCCRWRGNSWASVSLMPIVRPSCFHSRTARFPSAQQTTVRRSCKGHFWIAIRRLEISAFPWCADNFFCWIQKPKPKLRFESAATTNFVLSHLIKWISSYVAVDIMRSVLLYELQHWHRVANGDIVDFRKNARLNQLVWCNWSLQSCAFSKPRNSHQNVTANDQAKN